LQKNEILFRRRKIYIKNNRIEIVAGAIHLSLRHPLAESVPLSSLFPLAAGRDNLCLIR